jgi:hypothetical protein
LMVCRMGRSCPDVDCEAIFEPEEWKAVYMVVKRQTRFSDLILQPIACGAAF